MDEDRGEISSSLYCMVHMFWKIDIIIDVIFSCAFTFSLLLPSILASSCLLLLSLSYKTSINLDRTVIIPDGDSVSLFLFIPIQYCIESKMFIISYTVLSIV